jgi:nucleotide-binding universal stress UspA family protein
VRPLEVLVPLDGSELAEGILAHVLPGLPGAGITLLRVVPADAPADARASAAAELEALARRIEAQGGGSVRTLIAAGTPADQIVAVAADLRPTLIACMTHGRSGFDRLVLGSVAEKLIRGAPVPVLAVRSMAEPAPPAPRPLLARVLVPYDGSGIARRSLDVLAGLDGRRAARVTLLSVIEAADEFSPGPPGSGAARDELAVELFRLRRAEALEQLEAEAARARELGFAAEVDVALGGPAPRILDRADAVGASLIAMTTHGRAGITRWTLGSVTERVIRAAHVPVLVGR